MTQRVVVNVISDIVCPWCWIGKRSIELAAAEANVAIDLVWHPFQLEPSMPLDAAVDKLEHYLKKFGPRAQQMVCDPNNPLNQRGRPMGLEFVYHPGSKVFNTRRAHRLVGLSRKMGGGELQNKIQEILFRRYFNEGRNLGLMEELVEAAREAHIDEAIVKELFTRAETKDETAAFNTELRLSHETCDGVPYFTFPSGKVVSGGESISTFKNILAAEAKS